MGKTNKTKNWPFRKVFIICLLIALNFSCASFIFTRQTLGNFLENLTTDWSDLRSYSVKIERRRDDNPYSETTQYRLKRQERFSNRTNFGSWYNALSRLEKKGGQEVLQPNADENGAILDFAIVGFAKCGTTSIENNLAKLAPMPKNRDVCTPLLQTVWYSNVVWVDDFDHNGTKPLRGTKCPRYIHEASHMGLLPRMKLIVGIRHPIRWFESFWNMFRRNYIIKSDSSVYERMYWEPCIRCNGVSCPGRSLICMQRGRFHVALAAFGKTAMSNQERQLLSPKDADGGYSVQNFESKNPMFLYVQSELGDRYVWDELAEFLEVPYIPSDERVIGDASTKNIDMCDSKFDAFRAMFMPHAYNMSQWLLDYFLPVANNQSRPDVIVAGANAGRFEKVVETYKHDPCNTLMRLDDGSYVLKSGEALHWPTDEELLVEKEAILAAEAKAFNKTKYGH